MTLIASSLELFRGSRRGHRTVKPLSFESLELRELMTTSPFYIFNNTLVDSEGTRAFSDDQIYIALYSKDFSSSNPPFYYYDSTGAAHLTTTVANKILPTFKLSDLTPAGDHTYVINMPQELGSTSYGPNSARMYFFMSDSSSSVPQLTINGDSVGSVNGPVPGNNYYDYIEFSLNADNNPVGNLNIDTTNVDQLGVPIRILLDSTDPGNIPGGVGIDVPRDQIFQLYTEFTSTPGDPYRSLLDTNTGTYGSYRIQNPSDQMNGSQTAGSVVQVETVLQQDIGVSTTTFLVYSGDGFPDPNSTPFTIQIGDEQMLVTGAAPVTGGVNWTVQRGYNSTTPASHLVGALIWQSNPVVTASQTTLTVGSAIGYPTSYPFNVRVDGEIMTVTGLAKNNLNGTTTWNVLRGQFGSTATTHDQHAVIYYDSVTESEFNSYFNQAIDELFTKYLDGELLYVQSAADGTSRIYQGTVVQVDANGNVVPSGGTYVLQFVDSENTGGTKYNVFYPFMNANRYYWAGHTPALTPGDPPTHTAGANYSALSPSEMVFACNGVFADNTFREAAYPTDDEQKVLADLENQVVSALNRGVAQLQGINHTDPSVTANTWADHGQYYENNQQNQPWNHYAQFLHQTTVSIDGKNYGFAFDDQDGYASDIAVDDFNSARIVLETWSDSTPDPPHPTPPGGLSMRDFMASYLGEYGSEEAPPELAMALVADAGSEPIASPLSIVDEVLADQGAGLDFSGFLGQSEDDDEDDASAMPTMVASVRSLIASRMV